MGFLIKLIAYPLSALILALACLSTFNYVRMAPSDFNEAAINLTERSSSIKASAHPHYQEEVLASLTPNRYNGSYFRLDDKLSDAKVILEPSHLEIPDSEMVIFGYEFEEADQSTLISGEGRSTLRIIDGKLAIDHHDSDFLTNELPIDIAKDKVGEIIIRARSYEGKHIKFAWSRELNPSKRWSHRIDIPIISDDKFHDYAVNARNVLKRGLNVGDSIAKIFLKPSDVDGDQIEIDYIRFMSNQSKYLQNRRGITYETLGKELRKAIYMAPSQVLTYSLVVPAESPKMDFGVGILQDDGAINFDVSISTGNADYTIYSDQISSSGQWTDARLDLSQWAGKEVQLTLSAKGSEENIAFWSNPIVYSAPEKSLNVIIILEDALRADHLSAYGYERPTSPFKEKLLEGPSVQFLHAVSQSTKTRPSIPSLMTSLLPTATGVWHFSDALDDQYVTLAEVMRNQGFVTASFIQNGNAGPYAGVHQGFSTLTDAELLGDKPEDILGPRLMSWLERNRNRNFLLYLHVVDPHGVYDPPAPYDECYGKLPNGVKAEEFDDSLDPAWVEVPTAEGRNCLYDGEIRRNDEVISNFLVELRRAGLYDNTLFIFTSDHGEHMGEHGLWEHRPPGYLQGIHVPLMFVFPRIFRTRQKIAETVQLMDIMPTVLDISGVHASNLSLQGDSLLGLIEGRDRSYWENRIIISEEPTQMSKIDLSANQGLNTIGSVFYKDWHLLSSRKLWPTLGKDGSIPNVLKMRVFEFASDPQEEHQIIGFIPDVYLKYRFTNLLNTVQSNNIEAWEQWTNSGQGEAVRLDPDVLKRLEALGYIE